jgi:hypothetical protein
VGAGYPKVVENRVDFGNSETLEAFFEVAEIRTYERSGNAFFRKGPAAFGEEPAFRVFQVFRIAVEPDVRASGGKPGEDFFRMTSEPKRGVDDRDRAVLLYFKRRNRFLEKDGCMFEPRGIVFSRHCQKVVRKLVFVFVVF